VFGRCIDADPGYEFEEEPGYVAQGRVAADLVAGRIPGDDSNLSLLINGTGSKFQMFNSMCNAMHFRIIILKVISM
jgi:hypothetical protein